MICINEISTLHSKMSVSTAISSTVTKLQLTSPAKPVSQQISGKYWQSVDQLKLRLFTDTIPNAKITLYPMRRSNSKLHSTDLLVCLSTTSEKLRLMSSHPSPSIPKNCKFVNLSLSPSSGECVGTHTLTSVWSKEPSSGSWALGTLYNEQSSETK